MGAEQITASSALRKSPPVPYLLYGEKSLLIHDPYYTCVSITKLAGLEKQEPFRSLGRCNGDGRAMALL